MWLFSDRDAEKERLRDTAAKSSGPPFSVTQALPQRITPISNQLLATACV